MQLELCQKERLRVRIRQMILLDISEVLRIEKGSFWPCWTEKDFLSCFPGKSKSQHHYYTGMVAEIGEKIVGFMVYELYEDRIEVVNFVVCPDNRRKRIGSQMITMLASKLVSKLPTNRTKIVLRVRDHNENAQLFFRAQEFKAINSIRNYYKNGESAILMEYCPNHSVNGLPEVIGSIAQCGE